MLCLLFLSRGYFVFVASVSNLGDRSLILSLFYPDRHYFYVSLLVGLPAILCGVMVIYRDSIWKHNHHNWFTVIKPIILLALLADFIFHLILANHQYWRFSWMVSVTLLIDLAFMYYFANSRFIKAMLMDWTKPIED